MRNAENLVAELLDLFHKLFFGSLLFLRIQINFAHPKLNVDWNITKNTCLVKFSNRLLTTVDIFVEDASWHEAADWPQLSL